jgi:MFS family permease
MGGDSKDGLWAPDRRALTTGLVLTFTFMAAEALAVVTVMPLVAHDLKGLALYGWVFSAFMLASLVGIVIAGRDADRHGPARPYVVGLVLFTIGLIVAGTAPSMIVLVAGRVLQGLGAGAVPAVAYVAIGRSLPESLRARMMAMLSTAWVVPGVVGPGVAAAVAHLLSWRWVFLGLVPLVVVTGSLALPALIRLGPPDAQQEDEHKLFDGVRTAVGAGLLLAALASKNLPLGIVLGLLSGPIAIPALRRLLPAGTLSARRGLPATILSCGLLMFAFFGADAYVTLTVTTVRHHSTLLAGGVVTASTLSWTIASWVQARLNDHIEGQRLIRWGLTLLVIGTVGMALQLRDGIPVAEAFVAWSIGAFGIGLAYAPISLMVLRAAPAGREGWASASLNLVDVLGVALGVGIGGAAVAFVAREKLPVASGVLVAYGAAAVAALICVAVSRRLPHTLEPAHESVTR